MDLFADYNLFSAVTWTTGSRRRGRPVFPIQVNTWTFLLFLLFLKLEIMQILLHKSQSMDLFKVVTLFMFLFIFFGFVTGDVAVNCGSDGNSGALDGRQWVGDGTSSELVPKGKSKSSIAADKSFSADPVPYKTSRISASPFQYEFLVTAGQKFIRLHFYPAYYVGFRDSEDMFTVKAGPFTLLNDFSASLAAQTLGVDFLVKEFCLSIEQSSVLTISFSPSLRSSASRKVVAFVNGIEVISMPSGLYYTKDGDLGARNIGLRKGFTFIDDSTALELVERLNTGGTTVLSVEDYGLFRRWNGDSSYFLETGFDQVFRPVSIHADAAPSKVYQTSWKMEPAARIQALYVFRWKISVDVGFGYFVRLHFCHFGSGVADGGGKEFTVLMNDQIAETEVDLLSSSGRGGVPFYRDYMVMMKGVKEVGKCDLLIVLRSTDERVVGLLNGLEIFKLSNPDNNLAAPNLVWLRTTSSSTSRKQKIHKLFTLSQLNVIATGITLLLVLVNVIVHYLRQSQEESFSKEKDTMWHSVDPSFCCFSLYEIQSATQNFSDAALIGRGGFGKVYKGFITRISQVAAIKRLKADSKQGAREFWTEVETLSKFRHTHLVSLIGYCNESSEMILVYEYMPHGTLADHIYNLAKKGKDCVFLSWEQRLSICIGAARGLEYLHTGTEQGVIHRDVKDTNILLDENFVAKVSDFGLSKFEELSESKSHMSTKVKGTRGYLDPEYHMTGKLTRMVDVYAFGVVLLVVLSGRPVVDVRNTEEVQSLLSCFMECISERDFTVIVDPGLLESVVPSSLKEFVKTAEGCLHRQPKLRPTMAQVAASLDRAKEMQLRSIKKATQGPWVSAASTVEIRPMLNMKDLFQQHGSVLGSLHDILHGRKGVQPGPVLDWITRVRIAVDAARGLEYLHEKVNPAIIHRDIRSSNVLVFKDYKAKIADFNLSNQAPDMATRLHFTLYLETFAYYAPEFAMTGQLTQKSDVYSYGVVLLELLTGRKGFDDNMPRGQKSLVTWATPRLSEDKVKQCIDPKLKDFDPKGVTKLAAVAALCVQFEAELRPNMSIIVKALQPLLKTQVLAPPPDWP